MLRNSVVCELAEHDGTADHFGIARLLPGPRGGAVWATWQGDFLEPHFIARTPCPRTGGTGDRSLTPCALFEQHLGQCSFEISPAYAENPKRFPQILNALEGLQKWHPHQGEAPPASTEEAALLIWDELRACGIWGSLPDWDHAAMYRLLSRTDSVQAMSHDEIADLLGELAKFAQMCDMVSPGGVPGGADADALCTSLRRLPGPWQAAILGNQRPPLSRRAAFYDPAPRQSSPRTPLDVAIVDAAERAARGEKPPSAVGWGADWDLSEDRERGAVAHRRLTTLPHGWQVDAVRRIARGVEALSAVSEAGLAINIVRTYGVYLTSCAPS
ncbi:hypothetical protein ABR737_00855 [Streptomyces sp. Edi2]|uniref:hypothetical protein n=1 Tax=Streptomyces sp. Edi2 TaxID=3162528 RepID=UPI00330684D7